MFRVLEGVERLSESIGRGLIDAARWVDLHAYSVSDVIALGLILVAPFLAVGMIVAWLIC